MATVRTYVPGLLILYIPFGSHFSPVRDGPQDDFLPDGHGKVFDVLAGKIVTLMTASIPFLSCAIFDRTRYAVDKRFFGHTALASNVFCCEVSAIGKFALINTN